MGGVNTGLAMDWFFDSFPVLEQVVSWSRAQMCIAPQMCIVPLICRNIGLHICASYCVYIMYRVSCCADVSACRANVSTCCDCTWCEGYSRSTSKQHTLSEDASTCRADVSNCCADVSTRIYTSFVRLLSLRIRGSCQTQIHPNPPKTRNAPHASKTSQGSTVLTSSRAVANLVERNGHVRLV